MNKKEKVNKIIKDIKEVKIQGARNIAKAALYAYSLDPTKETKQKLVNSRATEPMLVNVLNLVEKHSYKKILEHFDNSQNKINKYVLKLIKSNPVIFTHCHSTNVVNSLIYAKKKGKKFSVINTETRPLFQGRKTASELAKNKIKITTIIDSAALNNIKKSDLIFFGADAILKNGEVINKIGSNMFSEIGFDNKKPIYIIADSWKFSSKNVKIEERDFHEVWKKVPKHIKIKNPAFAKINKKFIRAIVSELGILSPERFIKKVEKRRFLI